ncbi:MAG: hypothetical protein ABIJ14_03225 [Nanoarchaeota archaeon]
MTCANWKLTIFAAVILVLTFWPSLFSATITKWITVIAAVLVIVVAWTGVERKWCKDKKKAVAKKKR